MCSYIQNTDTCNTYQYVGKNEMTTHTNPATNTHHISKSITLYHAIYIKNNQNNAITRKREGKKT